MSETILIKWAISVLVLWLVAFPCGALYSRGKLTRNWVAFLIGIAAAGVVIVASVPDFEPLGPTVFATVVTGLLAAVGVRITIGLLGKFVRLPR